MTSTGNFFFDLLVWLNLYGIYVAIAFVPSVYYIWLRIFSFPLITRKTHEILIMITPEQVKIKKIKSRVLPFFTYRKGIYWFSEPFDDTESKNKFHIFIEGINQELSDIERRENKLDELITYTTPIKALSNHNIIIPKNFKGHMHRHYIITLLPDGRLFKLTPTPERQNQRYSFWHTIGFQIQTTEQIEDTEQIEEIENGSENTKVLLTQLTTQTILKKIKYIQEYNYFSSHSAYKISRAIKRTNNNFYKWLLGSIDPRLIILLIIILGGIALVYFGMPLLTPKLGPMPTQ